MKKEQMKRDILLEYKRQGVMPGEMIDIAFWEGVFLYDCLSEEREVFWTAVEELINEGYLQKEPIVKNISRLGTLKNGLWLRTY